MLNVNDHLFGKSDGAVIKAFKFDGTEKCIHAVKQGTNTIVESIRPEPDYEGSWLIKINGEEYYLSVGEYIILYENGYVEVVAEKTYLKLKEE